MTTEVSMPNPTPDRGEVLVAIINRKRDFKILREQGWYRVPVKSVKWRWPPQWLAFYQTRIFGKEAYAVNYYGRVRDFRQVKRAELFPKEKPNPKTDKEYYQVWLDSLEPLYRPIYSRRWRYIVFIPTTWEKFDQAVEINDLFHDSHLEDRLWAELKFRQIDAERQLDISRSGNTTNSILGCSANRATWTSKSMVKHGIQARNVTVSIGSATMPWPWPAGKCCVFRGKKSANSWPSTVFPRSRTRLRH